MQVIQEDMKQREVKAEALPTGTRRRYLIQGFIERNIYKIAGLIVVITPAIIQMFYRFHKIADLQKSSSPFLQWLGSATDPGVVLGLITLFLIVFRLIKGHGFKLLGKIRYDYLVRRFLSDLSKYNVIDNYDEQKQKLKDDLDMNPNNRPDYYLMDFAYGGLSLDTITSNKNKPEDYFKNTDLYKYHTRDWYRHRYAKSLRFYAKNDIRRFLINPFKKIYIYIKLIILGFFAPVGVLTTVLAFLLPTGESNARPSEPKLDIVQQVFKDIGDYLGSPKIPLQTMISVTLVIFAVSYVIWDVRRFDMNWKSLRLNRMLRKFIRDLKDTARQELTTDEVAVGLVENVANTVVINAKFRLQDRLKAEARMKRSDIRRYPDYYDLSVAYGHVTPELFVESYDRPRDFTDASMYVNHPRRYEVFF